VEVFGDVGGVVSVLDVPDDDDAHGEQSEGDGPFDGFLESVAGLADAEDVLRLQVEHLDAPQAEQDR